MGYTAGRNFISGSLVRPWTEQPHEAASLRSEYADAAACFLPSTGPFDIACNKPWEPFTTIPVISPARYGVASDTSVAFGGYTLVTSKSAATAEQTHILCVEALNTAGVYAGLFGVSNAAGSAVSYSVQRNSGNDSWRIWNSITTTASLNLATAFGPSVMAVAGSSAGSECWVDGTQTLTEGSIAPTARTDSRIALHSAWDASTTYATKSRIWFYLALPRRLGPTELRYLTEGGVDALWGKVFIHRTQRIWTPGPKRNV